MSNSDLLKDVEELTGVVPLPGARRKKLTREEIARVERFLRLPPKLQEGILKYGENIRQRYADRAIDKA